jgi:hypothetical protein
LLSLYQAFISIASQPELCRRSLLTGKTLRFQRQHPLQRGKVNLYRSHSSLSAAHTGAEITTCANGAGWHGAHGQHTKVKRPLPVLAGNTGRARDRVGLDAVISHDSALALYEVSDGLPAHIHIAVLRSASRRRPSYRLHTGRIAPADIMHCGGLQVTAVARTIAEVALAGLPEESVEQAAREAVAAGPVQP